MKHKTILFLVVILSACLSGVASNVFTPSFIAVAQDFAVNVDDVQWGLSALAMGLSLSQLVYGPASEVFGRRRPLIAGLLIMIIGNIICFNAPSISWLIFGQFIQGFGAGAGASLWRSIFRDSFSGPELAKYGAHLSILMIFFIPASPTLGGYLLEYFGWRSNFVFLTIYSIITIVVVTVLFRESSKHHHRDNLSRKFYMNASWQLLSSPVFMGNSFCAFLCFGAFFSWIATSPILLIKVAGMNPVEFGWITFLIGGLAMGLGSFVNGKLVMRFGTNFTLRFGLIVMCISGVMMLALKWIYGVQVAAIIVPALLFYFGVTFIWPSTFSGAFTPFGKIAGYAGSLYTFIQIGGGAVFGALVAYLPDNDQSIIGIIFLTIPMLAWIVHAKLVVANT